MSKAMAMAVAAGTVLGLAACKKPVKMPTLPTIVAIEISGAVSRGGNSALMPEAERLSAVLEDAMTASGRFAVELAGPKSPPAQQAAQDALGRFELELRVLSVKQGGGKSGRAARARGGKKSEPSVAVEVELRSLSQAPDASASADAQREWRAPGEAKGAGGESIRDLAERATRVAVASLLRRHELLSADVPALLAAMEDPQTGDELRVWCVQELGRRRAGEAVPLIASLLNDDDPSMSKAALRALVRIGDPSAVKHLHGLIDLKDDEQTNEVVRAVAEIGGTEAEAMLFTLSTGHPSQPVKDESKRALQRIQRNAAAKAKAE